MEVLPKKMKGAKTSFVTYTISAIGLSSKILCAYESAAVTDEVHIDNEQEFMDMYVDKIVTILENELIDIFVNPTFLPAVIAERYDELWTQQRMQKVIQAAVRNGVAIEINARYRIPSVKFIKLAKQAGVKFSFGTNNGSRELGHLEYSLEAAEQCELTKEDMFFPKPYGEKPVQLKGHQIIR